MNCSLQLKPAMSSFLRRALVVIAILLAWPLSATAQSADSGAPFEAWTQSITTAEARLNDATMLDYANDYWVELLENLVTDAREVAAASRERASPFVSQLDALGPPPEDGTEEAESLKKEREVLQAKVGEIEADARRAEALIARAEQTLERLRDRRREAFAERLFTRSSSPLSFGVLSSAAAEYADAMKRGREQHEGILRRLSEEGLLRTAVFVVMFGVSLAAGLIILLRKVVITRLIASVSPDASQMRKLLVAVALAASRLIIPLSAIAVIDLSLERFSEFGVGDLTALNAVVTGATMVIVVYALAYTYYAPKNATLRLADLDESRVRRAAHWAVALAVIFAVDELMLAFATMHALGSQAMSVANLLIVTISAIAFWRFIAVNRGGAAEEDDAPPAADSVEAEAAAEAEADNEDDDEDELPASEPIEASLSRVGRIAAVAIACFSPVAAVLGFHELSRYTIENIVLTTALFGVCTLLYAVVRGGVDALAATSGAEKPEGGRPADFSLAPVVFGVFLAIAAAPAVALIWGVTEDDLLSTYRSIADGIHIGDFVFSPIDVVFFIVVLIIGVLITRTMQSILRGTILPRTKLDEGARASLVSGFGYVGFPVAALAAVGAVGLDLSNIAIVAGALSVGIGFGLQNVVNNFVSGIILLIERPVKIGDWIVVGGEHGYVRKINVRSTEIQTFDRTTLIVPNSELISTTVTNYTHNDVIGRVIAPVGVAYGTDPRKVERILMQIARSNRLLRRYPPPQVLFMGFGDSSLDFELRGILRDVNQILAAHSELNFEIARRFADEGIEIPFPQRDVNLRDIDRLASAIRGDPEPESS